MSTRKNTLYNVSYRLFSVLLPIVTAPYLARTVGEVGTGLYAYAWAISALFVLLGNLGLENYGVRAIAQVKDDRKARDRVFSEIYRMQLVVAATALALYLVYALCIAGAEKTIALYLTFMSVSCLVNLDWLLMGLGEFKPIALRNTVVKLAGMVSIFVLIHGPEDLWIYALVWAGTTLLGCLSCWIGLGKRVRFVPVTWKAAMQHLPGCAVLFISVLAVSVYRTMDKVMVGAISGMAQNGLYENAEKIIYCLSGFISAIGTVMMPKVAAMLKRGETERVKKHITLSMELILCMTCALAFGVAAVAPRFARLFYGDNFAYSGTLMIPLGFTLIMIGFANVVRTQWVLPCERDSIFVWSVCSGAVVNLVANLALIPRFAAMGAVIGTLLAEGTVPFVQWLFLRRELPYGAFVRSLIVYALLGLIMAAAVRGVMLVLPFGGWAGLAAGVAAGCVVYGGLCLLLWKGTRRSDILRLFRLKRGRA